MVAEVQTWAVLSWASIGIGDTFGIRPGGDEVLVLGGAGAVRWEVHGHFTGLNLGGR
jgi:hypothetical protein